MPPRKSIAQRIAQARKVHGDKYDYSLWPTDMHSKTRVVSICPIHGEWHHNVTNHVSGTGCPTCGGLTRPTRIQRIVQARQIHGVKYNYPSWHDMMLTTAVVDITCVDHGVFTKTLGAHLRGAGCNICAGTKLNKEQRIVQAKATHGNLYDYSLWPEDIAGSTRVKTICKIHGAWCHSVSGHIQGYGCSSCACTRLTKEDRIIQSCKIHGNKYDYSLWPENITALTRVSTICKIHGIFSHKLDNHINGGKGCPSCAIYGFNPLKEGGVYVLRTKDYIKVGLSNNPLARIKHLVKVTPFDFKHEATHEFDIGRTAFCAEQSFHAMADSAHLSGFDGCTEWFKITHKTIEALDILTVFGPSKSHIYP